MNESGIQHSVANGGSTNKKLTAIQLFRGLAALGVVVHHAAQSANGFALDSGPEWLLVIASMGYLGVDFFFVLSGFIILYIHCGDKKSISASKNYFAKRLLRIYPPYLPISIALLIAYVLFPGVSGGDRQEISVISSLFLVPSGDPPALSVAWTLIHEMVFYCFFLIFFISNRIFFLSVVSWVVLIVCKLLFDIETTYPLLNVFFAPINLEFILGMFCAYVYKSNKHNSLYSVPLIILGLVLFFIIINLSFYSRENSFLVGIPFALIVTGGALLHVNKQAKIPNVFVLLGDASYSIYLVHNPFLSVSSRLIRMTGSYATWSMTFVVGILSSVMVGFIYHLFVEKTLVRLFKRHETIQTVSRD